MANTTQTKGEYAEFFTDLYNNILHKEILQVKVLEDAEYSKIYKHIQSLKDVILPYRVNRKSAFYAGENYINKDVLNKYLNKNKTYADNKFWLIDVNNYMKITAVSIFFTFFFLANKRAMGASGLSKKGSAKYSLNPFHVSFISASIVGIGLFSARDKVYRKEIREIENDTYLKLLMRYSILDQQIDVLKQLEPTIRNYDYLNLDKITIQDLIDQTEEDKEMNEELNYKREQYNIKRKMLSDDDEDDWKPDN